ncbi:MAG: transcription antitermination factor NusB [Nitrospinota bacterium]
MTTRRKAREAAVKLLYQWDMTEQDVEEILASHRPGAESPLDVDAFCLELVEGTVRQREAIDAEISRWSAHWSLERMSTVDRNILRLAVYELLYRRDIPPKATINEAIELAKKFSTADSAAFVNGILDRVLQSRSDQEAEEPSLCD